MKHIEEFKLMDLQDKLHTILLVLLMLFLIIMPTILIISVIKGC